MRGEFLKLKDLEIARAAWFHNFKRPPEEALASLAHLAQQIPQAAPEDRQQAFGKALLLLLEAAKLAGLDYSELQSYRFKSEPGWRNCLIVLTELQAEPLDHEHFSCAFCALWHAASTLKIWRQDVIRGAAATLKTLQLELFK